MSVMLGQDAHAIPGDFICAAHFQEKTNQTKWKQPPFCALKRGGYIMERKQKTHHIIVMRDDLDQAMICDRHNISNNKINLPLCERIVFPVTHKGIVVSRPNAVRPLQ